MEKFMSWIEVKLMPVAFKMSNQRHMRAIRQGIVATLPLTIVGSFFVILLNLPITGYAEFIEPYKAIVDVPFRFTVGILALYATYGMGAALAKSYDLDEVGGGLLATVGFLISTVVPVQVTESVEGVIASGRYLNIASLSSSSLFGAIVASIISIEIYRIMKEKKITIKMPEGVPPEVSNSFAALLPALVIILLFWVLRHFLNFDISALLSKLLMPLKDVLAGNSLIGGLITVFLITFFWALGIHGPAIMGPVIRPIWDVSIAENMTEFTNGVAASNLPNIFTEQFLQWFVWIGGAGTTLALVFLFLTSKSKYLKSLGRLSLLPGLFNINEPIIFGAPIVMNPVLAIPFILAPLVLTTLSYFLTITGVIPLMMARLPFTMPSPVAAVMSTNWNLMAGVLVVINFIIALLIYYPFFKMFEKQQLSKELLHEVEEIK
ncbi:PTS sugar transporter subunit IIC [Clostridium sartagoforme]|uniref:Permease IIC component n=2 Tax=Clostridium TaxID=1485 RepID=A0A4V6RDV4_9CLOT|nr:PTS transporter subunit EIIC [Clostridium sartagoforme]MBS5938471.1 PTS sugar transporter subunit IIC [Clostridium sp.]TGY44530.1 PTS sugar transporter subunit IIC [Clostridium sartagoforme]